MIGVMNLKDPAGAGRTIGARRELPDDGPDNQVRLRGRLGDVPVIRELPSGDLLATFRLTVARPAGARVRVDSLECATVDKRVLRTLERAQPGDVVTVFGCLHRRFWRSPKGPTSRYAVDVARIRITRAGRPGAATTIRKPASG